AMSLPDSAYSLSSEGLPLQHPSQLHPFDVGMQSSMGQQHYVMGPPSALSSTVFLPPHSSLPSTSSPITSSSPFALPTGQSTSAGPLKRRRFSGAKIQPTRIKKVMQSDEEIGRMVASVPVAVGRSMEHFAEKFLVAAAQVVATSGARTLSPHHLKLAMLATPHFAFLEPILREVGVPAKAGEAYQYPQQATLPQQEVQPMKIEGMPQMQHHHNMYMNGPSMIPSGLPSMMGTPINPYAMHNPYFMPQLHQQETYDPLASMGQMMGVGTSVPYQNSPLISPIASSPITSPTGNTPIAPAPRSVRRSSSTVSNGEGDGGAKRPRGRPRKNKKEKCVEDDLDLDSTMANNATLKAPSPGDIKTASNEADRLLMPPPPLLPIKPS
ncbi:hypothetical protein PENTCL1PPCAC_2275, partial [Pristionchus entomophagus]